MVKHQVATREEWLAARNQLLAQEKEQTRRGGQLAAERRNLPWVPIEKEYRFDTDEGPKTLPELFDERSQLIVYHFMFGPAYTPGCPVCSPAADTFNGVVPHLNARDVTFACISRAPLDKLQTYQRRMGGTSHGPPPTAATTTSTWRSRVRRRQPASSWPAASPGRRRTGAGVRDRARGIPVRGRR
jgi:predicted dithiol-disulfide oxidoreductase (DUF899 family)